MADSSIVVSPQTQAIIETVVIWWVAALKDVKLDDGNMSQEVIDRARAKAFKPQPEAALREFLEVLTRRLEELLQTPGAVVRLEVGHRPGLVLMQCGREAGLEMSILNWPWFTTMIVTNTQVSVSHGFEDPETVIWSE